MGGPTVTQRVHRGALVVATLFERGAEGLLHAALGHWLSRLHQVDVVTAFSGKEQPRIAMRFPIAAQQLQRPLWQRHITILRAFAVAHVQHQAPAVDVGDVQVGSLL